MAIELTNEEILIGAVCGVVRQVNAIRRHAAPAYGLSPEDSAGWDKSINGAIAELAVAKFLRRYWSGVERCRASDVSGVEVRSTPYPDGHLLLNKPDPDDCPFVLVTGIAPDLVLRGWIVGRDGKRPEYWGTRNGRSCFWVPQGVLRSMGGLELFLERKGVDR